MEVEQQRAASACVGEIDPWSLHFYQKKKLFLRNSNFLPFGLKKMLSVDILEFAKKLLPVHWGLGIRTSMVTKTPPPL